MTNPDVTYTKIMVMPICDSSQKECGSFRQMGFLVVNGGTIAGVMVILIV